MVPHTRLRCISVTSTDNPRNPFAFSVSSNLHLRSSGARSVFGIIWHTVRSGYNIDIYVPRQAFECESFQLAYKFPKYPSILAVMTFSHTQSRLKKFSLYLKPDFSKIPATKHLISNVI
jgi:hypothetical protein